ncbi:MAG: hypothetical protein JNL11_09875 [Bdellovibrionaceae bacterium]|nr:hypothetical protein [Pseudobdellovibrionaceae bacterium]
MALRQMTKKFVFRILWGGLFIILIGFQNCSQPGSASSPSNTTTTAAQADTEEENITTSVYTSPAEVSTISSPTVLEGSSVDVTITMVSTSSTARVFKYMTVDNSAYSGYNYVESYGDITIPAYTKTVTVTLSTINDGQSNGDLYFYLYVGQLDLTDPVYVSSTITILEAGGSTSQILATGAYHSCAVDSNQSAWCWGYNNRGQLGDGSTTNSTRPQSVPGLASGVSAIAAGTYHSCAIVNLKLQCWGYNGNGQIGTGNKTDYYAPKNVSNLTSAVTAVSAGSASTCAIKSGALYCWGNNSYGQLGIGSTVEALTPTVVSGMDSSVTHISVGYSHACAIRGEALYCWGRNSSGEVGDGTTTDQINPQPVSGMESGVTSVAAGFNHTCAVQSGRVKCWGLNTYGQLGTSNTTAHLAPYYNGISNALKVAVNLLTSCVLLNDQSVKCWGYNGYGQLGTGSTTGGVTAPNTVFSSGGDAISQGHGYHACGYVNSAYYCWGYNYYGQLGNGSYTTANTPQAFTF